MLKSEYHIVTALNVESRDRRSAWKQKWEFRRVKTIILMSSMLALRWIEEPDEIPKVESTNRGGFTCD